MCQKDFHDCPRLHGRSACDGAYRAMGASNNLLLCHVGVLPKTVLQRAARRDERKFWAKERLRRWGVRMAGLVLGEKVEDGYC